MLEGIGDRRRGRQDLIKIFLNELRHLQRMEGRALNAHGDVAQPAGCCRIGQEVIGQERVEIEDGVAVKADLVGGADQELDRVLVVQDHLRFEVRAAVCLFAQFNETLGVEERVCVALEAA